MSIDTQIIESRIDDEEEGKKIREAELKRDIDLGNVYEAMKKTEGWKMLEKAILDRSSSLSNRLLTVENEKLLYRLQGEILGIQSILNIVDSVTQIADEARNILKEGE